jgi:hypothetical protein
MTRISAARGTSGVALASLTLVVLLTGCDDHPGENLHVALEHPAYAVGAGMAIGFVSTSGRFSVLVELSRDGGQSWGTISPGPVGGTGASSGSGSDCICESSWTWTVDSGGQPLPQSDCLIRASDATDGIPSAVSDPFRIQERTLWRVDASAPQGGDGLSWATAFDDIGMLSTAATSGDECWLASGTYTLSDTLCPDKSLVVRGGFVGNESSASGRQPWVNRTILQPPTGVSFPILRVEDGGSVTLDGLTFRGGTVPANGTGAAVQAKAHFVSILDCAFESISSDETAALFLKEGTQVSVEKCIFTGNSAPYGYATAIGAVGPTSISISECLFFDNHDSRVLGVLNAQTATVSGCTFTGNVSSYTIPIEVLAIFSGSTAVSNSIIWGNTNSKLHFEPTETTYSLVEGGYAGAGNIDADPLFVDASDPDGPDDVWMTADDGLALLPGSPCIDAANGDVASPTDILGGAREDDPSTTNTGVGTPPYADMGAYEYHP